MNEGRKSRERKEGIGINSLCFGGLRDGEERKEVEEAVVLRAEMVNDVIR